jgi:hypothetical protein
LREEVLCPGAGNRAQVGNQFFLVHPDAGVSDGESLLFLVDLQVDARRERDRFIGVIHKREVPQLVQGV